MPDLVGFVELVKRHSFKIDLDIGKKGDKKTIEIVFFKDAWGRIRLQNSKELPKEARKFKGTLLHALYSTCRFDLVKTDLGFRLKGKDGSILEYEFTLTTKDGDFGIPYRTNLFTSIREYVDLRNIRLSGYLEGAVLSIKINSANCDLKDSTVKEIRRVSQTFCLYGLDGSQTRFYRQEKGRIQGWHDVLGGWERGYLLQRMWLLPNKAPSVQKAFSFTEFDSCFGKSHLHSSLAIVREAGWQPSHADGHERPQHINFAQDGFDVLAEGLPSLHLAAGASPSFKTIAVGQKAAKTPKNISFSSGKENCHHSPRNTCLQSTPQAKANKTVKPVPLSRIRKLKAVIFDLDGSIVDSERAHLVTFNETLAPLGIRIDERSWRKAYAGIGSVAIVEDLFRRHKVDKSVMEWVAKRADAYQKHVERHGLPKISGFMSFHSFLLQNGIKVVVGSSGHKSHISATLKSIGIPDTLFIGLEDVKRIKPAPDIFLRAAEMVGAKPDECLVVEDALSGIMAASSAGMPCIALTTTLPKKELEGKAAVIVSNFKSIRLRRKTMALIKKAKQKKNRKNKKMARAVCKV